MQKLLLALLFIGTCCASCKENVPKSVNTPVVSTTKNISGDFIHTVLFWLNDPSDSNAKKTFEKNLYHFLESCQHISSYQVGTPAMTPREVVDNSYSYCLVVTFDSVKEHDLYQEDPVHLTFIDDTKHLWERVQIYDSVNLR